MNIVYQIFKGSDSSGPIDYTRPVAEVPGTSWPTGPRPAPSDAWYGVRARDLDTGLAEPNIDVTLRLTIDAQGRNVSNPPPSPVGITATPSGTDGALVQWKYLPAPGLPEPDSFNIYINQGLSVDFGQAPALSVLFVAGVQDYRATLGGLASGISYSVGVRSTIGAAEDQGQAQATVTPKGTPPLPVSGLRVAATHQE